MNISKTHKDCKHSGLAVQWLKGDFVLLKQKGLVTKGSIYGLSLDRYKSCLCIESIF